VRGSTVGGAHTAHGAHARFHARFGEASTESVAGPVNFVAPNPVDNAEFTRTLARVLGRPALFPVPAVALELTMGEMARDTVLASQRVRPKRLLDSGFAFEFPTLESALRAELNDALTSSTRSSDR